MNPVQLFKPRRFGDERGWFTEFYHQLRFAEAGVDVTFVQDNHSLSRPVGTLRGLHFQSPPFAQAKLVRCIAGRIYDVAVDIRQGSPTFGRHVGIELSAENGWQLFIPAGFAHGFVTLEADCEITYKVSAHYSPAHDFGVRWDDPALGIVWPLPKGSTPLLSDKDAVLPNLSTIASPFAYDGHPLRPLSP